MQTKQMDFTSNVVGIKIKELVKNYQVRAPNKYDKLNKEQEVTFILRKNINVYLEELENITSRKMSCHQKEAIKSYVYANDFYKIDIVEHNKNRREFHQNSKTIRQEWEIQTEQDWPKYEEDIYVNGKLWRMKGGNYDAHHIVELSFGGPNEWYNIFPAASPFEHPNSIHASGSVCTAIFGDINNSYEGQKSFEILVLEESRDEEMMVRYGKQKESKVTKISKNIIRIN